MNRYVAVLAVIGAVGAGSAFGSSQAPDREASAATDRAVVKELRAVRKQLRTLNANVGNRFSDEPMISQLSDIKRSTEQTCKSVAPSSYTPC